MPVTPFITDYRCIIICIYNLIYANHGFQALCRFFFARWVKKEPTQKKSTMLPFVLNMSKGRLEWLLRKL